MAKIFIFAGEHPAETTGIPIARETAKELKKQGHEIEFEIIREKLPKGGTKVGYRASGEPVYQGTRDFRPETRSARVEKAAREHPDCFVFSFHNYGLPDYWSKTLKERNRQIRGARQEYGGIYDPPTRTIIWQHSEHNRANTKLPNLFTVEIPAITTRNERFDFPIANLKLSKQFGYTEKNVAQRIAGKISRIVAGKRMHVMVPKKYPKIIKRKKIRIKKQKPRRV